MKQILSTSLLLSVCLMIFCTFSSCKKDEEISGIDKLLFDLAKETSGFVWFAKSDALLNKSSGSGHGEPFLRTRYNTIAATRLDSNGRILPGSVFPDSSLIVKELFKNSTTLGRYAILYKKAGDPDADAKGWVWSYLNADETVEQSASKKGKGCNGCHSQADNIDYMLMNKYFP